MHPFKIYRSKTKTVTPRHDPYVSCFAGDTKMAINTHAVTAKEKKQLSYGVSRLKQTLYSDPPISVLVSVVTESEA